MLNVYQIKEQPKVIGSDLYAVIEETGERRVINEFGCELLKSHQEQLKVNEKEIKFCYDRIKALGEENEAHQIWIGELFKCGFCEINEKKFKRDSITGQVIEEYYDHKLHCKNAIKAGK